MGYNRSAVVAVMQSWVGKKESDGSHHAIIDEYNRISPLPSGYKVKYTDSWCATTVSAAFHKVGYSKIFPLECSCPRMVASAKKMGIWQENDAYVPSAGDCIVYDWQDNGVGDNTGTPDHVGMVEKVSGSTITVIEGNYNDSVKRRDIKVNGKYIRGYICPKFTNKSTTTTTKTSSSTKTQTTLAPATATVEEKTIWDFLMSNIKNSYGVAGLMGNLYAESGLLPNNLQNSYNAKLNMTDAQYTSAVDNGSYANFAKDTGGYGLAQWSSASRKESLYKYAVSKGASIGNLSMQLNFLLQEIKGYTAVYKVLTSATSVLEASNAVLSQYESSTSKNSADTQKKRASYGQTYYDKYVSKSTSSNNSGTVTPKKTVKATNGADKFTKTLTGDYTVTASNLYIRNGGGTKYSAIGSIPKGTVVQNYGYYSVDSSGTKWLYIAVTYNGTAYSGFCASTYLKKK